MVTELDWQTIVNEFDSHWVPYNSDSAKLTKAYKNEIDNQCETFAIWIFLYQCLF